MEIWKQKIKNNKSVTDYEVHSKQQYMIRKLIELPCLRQKSKLNIGVVSI